MPEPIFTHDRSRALNALAYLQSRLPRLTRLQAFKLLYLADKRHLELYGRPITYDRYAAMENGPVPSATYDFVVKSTGGGRSLPKLPAPDLEEFSDSEQEVLDWIVKNYGLRDTSYLVRLTHDGAWRSAWSVARERGKGSEPIAWEKIIEQLENGSDVFQALFTD